MLIRNVTLPDGRSGLDVLVQAGRIAAIAPEPARARGRAGDRRRRASCSARPSSTRTSTWTRRSATACRASTPSGTLLEGIALWGELKPLLTQEALVERALQYCDWAVAKGLLAIRIACRRVRRPAARGRGAAARARAGAALPRPAARRLSAGRRAALAHRAGQPEARARPGRRRGRRHPALRAHHGRRRRERAHPVRTGRRARPARRHALRRERRPAVAPHRDAGLPHAAARACTAASPARTSRRCIRWTTTTCPSCCR